MQREKAREAFIEFGATLNAIVADLVTGVTSYDKAEGEEEDSVKSMAEQVAALKIVPAGDAADSTSTAGFAEGILKEIRASRIASLKNILKVLEQMTITDK